MATKDVVKKSKSDVAVIDFLKEAKKTGITGFEGMDKSFQSMPQCKIAGYKSEETMEGQPGYIEGLKPGMLFNSVSKNILTGKNGKAPLIIIGFFHGFTRFGAKMGDFKGNYTVEEMEQKTSEGKYEKLTFSTYATSEKVEIDGEDKPIENCRETISIFVISAKHPKDGLMLFPFASTGFPLAKKWIQKARAVKIPGTDERYIYASIWDVGTYLEPNKKYKSPYFKIGDTTPDVTQIGLLTDDKYEDLAGPVLEAVEVYKERMLSINTLVVDVKNNAKVDESEEDFI